MDEASITQVPGILIGHFTDEIGATGCTVVLCESGAVGGVDVRGSAPGTRETDLLLPTTLVDEVHAVVLSGGSVFGLDAASGVVRYLEERDVGFDAGNARVPIVPAAVLYDLGIGQAAIRPGADDGYRACQVATAGPVDQGCVGAGTGATVAKLYGIERAVKGGIGTSIVDLGRGLMVGAIVAVNAFGGVFDHETGELVAGPRQKNGMGMIDPLAAMASSGFKLRGGRLFGNTTIGVVATNAPLTKEQANKVASAGHDGIAMAVRPAHTMVDGDTIFTLSTRNAGPAADMLRICAAATLSVSAAIVAGVRKARGLAGIPAVTELTIGREEARGGDANGTA